MIGATHAQELMAVLADAEAVATATEFIELYSPNVAVHPDYISLPIGTQYEVSFVAIGHAHKRTAQAGVDWGAVRRLKLMDLSQC